jgi:hypothetical protein
MCTCMHMHHDPNSNLNSETSRAVKVTVRYYNQMP